MCAPRQQKVWLITLVRNMAWHMTDLVYSTRLKKAITMEECAMKPKNAHGSPNHVQ
jgi:hypothetical protein